MKFFVTGATGLVGSHVAGRLLARGDSVRALVRRPEAAENLRARGIDVSMGDIGDGERLRAAVEGSDAVVHCAGAVNLAGDRDLLWEVNVKGTERLLAASVEARVSRFVYLSSVAVYGPAPAPVREDAPKAPAGAYGASKWEAEKVLQQYERERGFPTVVLRPCTIYGEGDRHAVQALSRVARLPLIPLPRHGNRLLDLVHASDVADAVLTAATSSTAVGKAYNITDGEKHTHRDILVALGRITGRRPWILSLPGPAVAALKAVPNWLQYVSPGAAKRMRRIAAIDTDIHYAIDAARRDLGYEPKVRLQEGLELALRWANKDAA
jgi:nucleoside-diphosphate-sugar epimerase